MTLAQIPEIGFFVQNSRIGVKDRIFSPKDMMKPKIGFKLSAETKTI